MTDTSEILVHEEERMERLETCKKCPKYVNHFLWVFRDEKWARCGVCKCFLNVKTRLKGVECPEGKW